jgi:hypothetical protein
MIQHLIAARNSSITEWLSKQMDSVCISSYPGEDVSKVVTHLRGIVRPLKNMHCKDLTKRLYAILQTSSCAEFNAVVKTWHHQEYWMALTGTGPAAWSDPESVLTLAENLYMDLEAEKQWPGGNQNKATFPVFSSP